MTLATIDRPADRLDWLKLRKNYFSASDAGALYNLHPFKTLADVAVDKLSPEVEDQQNEAMERGERLEPLLLEWFADRHGCTVEVPKVLYVCDRLMATLDGVIVGADDLWVEAKTTSQRWDEPPEHVLWQVRAQAAASGKRECHIVWLDADMRFKSHAFTPDPADCADVVKRASDFFDFIDLGMTPEGVDLSADHLARLFPSPVEGQYAEVDDEGLQAIVLWEQLRLERIAVEKAEKEAKDVVARLIADAEGVRYGGQVVATWKPNKPSLRLDTKALEADYPEIVCNYRREVVGPRVLRATKALTVEEAA